MIGAPLYWGQGLATNTVNILQALSWPKMWVFGQIFSNWRNISFFRDKFNFAKKSFCLHVLNFLQFIACLLPTFILSAKMFQDLDPNILPESPRVSHTRNIKWHPELACWWWLLEKGNFGKSNILTILQTWSEASAEIFRWEREWRKLNRLCRKWEWNVFSVSRHFLTVGWFNYGSAFWPLDFFWCLHRPRRLKEIEREGIKRIIQPEPDIAASENRVSCTL